VGEQHRESRLGLESQSINDCKVLLGVSFSPVHVPVSVENKLKLLGRIGIVQSQVILCL
jgi:hypothetical protein